MALDTLTITVDAGASGQTDLRNLKTQYGDGYAQMSGDGINNNVKSWNITKAGPMSEVGPLRDFLDAHQGYIGFYWTPPNGVQGVYYAEQYNETAKHGSEMTLQTTLHQKFLPA